MSIGECLMILIVALCVLGPNKLPMLSRHGIALWKKLEKLRFQWQQFWHHQVNQDTLVDNLAKAKQSDQRYMEKSKNEDQTQG